MSPRERIEMIRVIELIHENESYCRKIGLIDRTELNPKQESANNDKCNKE